MKSRTVQNCWDFKNCGRNPGGANAAELGVCPAAVDASMDGTNEGTNAGRICWAVTGTFCGGTVQGTFAQKKLSCLTCEFFKAVTLEEKAIGKFTFMHPSQQAGETVERMATPLR